MFQDYLLVANTYSFSSASSDYHGSYIPLESWHSGMIPECYVKYRGWIHTVLTIRS
jgi:hypothetical protein